MYEITAKLIIKASPQKIWQYMSNLDNWWVDSNPEHDSLVSYSESREINKGTIIRIREQVAGVPGEALGEITEFIPEKRVTWQADQAIYRYIGLKIPIKEGVAWSLRPTTEGTELSAHVWAIFPDTLFGRVIEWCFKHILKGVQKDYEHAMRELMHVKNVMETTN